MPYISPSGIVSVISFSASTVPPDTPKVLERCLISIIVFSVYMAVTPTAFADSVTVNFISYFSMASRLDCLPP